MNPFMALLMLRTATSVLMAALDPLESLNYKIN
jgi:hypothetical protein